MSDVPIRFSREMRKRMIASTKVKTTGGYLSLLGGLKMAHLAPEVAELKPTSCLLDPAACRC